jgi:hypothetical protein
MFLPFVPPILFFVDYSGDHWDIHIDQQHFGLA